MAPSGRLSAWVRECPQEPWIFYPKEGRWRWISWLQAADAVSRICDFVARRWPPGARLAFRAGPGPEAVLLDLAVEAAGRFAVPAVATEVVADAWLDAPAGGPPAAGHGLETVEPPSVRSRLSSLEDPGELPRSPHGDVSVAAGRLPLQLLEDAVQQLEAGLPAWDQRPLALGAAPLTDPACRLLITWSLRSGAALLLAPEVWELPSALAWTRPHLALARGADLPALAQAHASVRRSYRRLRVLWIHGEPADTVPAAFSGLRLQEVPELAVEPAGGERPG